MGVLAKGTGLGMFGLTEEKVVEMSSIWQSYNVPSCLPTTHCAVFMAFRLASAWEI
jgi:hypothetical protein